MINAFVEFKKDLLGCQNLRVDRWPDKEIRCRQEIDAVAGHFAIEHTSIDSIEDQRDARFFCFTDGLDSVISDCVDCGFTITFDYKATREALRRIKRVGPSLLHDDLKRWILDSASDLRCGSHEIELPTLVRVDPPIVMSIRKGQRPAVRGIRRAVAGPDKTLTPRLKRILDKKAKKLRKYQDRYTTILLFESIDIALMNPVEMRDAFQKAYPDRLPNGADEIWFADTSAPPTVWFWELRCCSR